MCFFPLQEMFWSFFNEWQQIVSVPAVFLSFIEVIWFKSSDTDLRIEMLTQCELILCVCCAYKPLIKKERRVVILMKTTMGRGRYVIKDSNVFKDFKGYLYIL